MVERRIPKVVIIDSRLGNMFSVQHACLCVGLNPVITSDRRVLGEADAAILPGVGAFGEAMKNLEKLDIVYPIRDFIDSGKPFMGVCLGMQLLFSESEEFGPHRGLGVIEGQVTRFSEEKRIPQIGWNQIFRPTAGSSCVLWESSPLGGIPEGEYMYFVHSYYVDPASQDAVLALTDYEGTRYCSAILKNNVFATQFHPEKSAEQGIRIYANWADKITNRNGLLMKT